MAKKFKIENKNWVADSLRSIRAGTANLSYHLLRQLEKSGLIEPVFVKIDGVNRRPIKSHILTNKGVSTINKTRNREITSS